MLKSVKTTLLAAAAALACAGTAGAAAPDRLAAFDVRSAQGWSEKLVLCDYTAFLSGHPDLNANRMWVRREDGHSDLMLPPDFVGGGDWYKEGYRRLYWKMKKRGEIDWDRLLQTQNTLGRDFVQAYRDHRWGRVSDQRFLRDQDAYCRQMARNEGEIIF